MINKKWCNAIVITDEKCKKDPKEFLYELLRMRSGMKK